MSYEAIRQAGQRVQASLVHGSLFDLPFADKSFDLVFTCGVLIHLHPSTLLRPAMKLMDELSRNACLLVEYDSLTFREIPYRSHKNVLWKGPYGTIFVETTGRKLKQKYTLGKDKGFDDCIGWLY